MAELDERLSLIKELVPVCDIVADIGSDHGYLGTELLKSGKAKRLIFNDISPVSLEKSRAAAEKAFVASDAAFYLGDGFNAINKSEKIDAAVIAGMGAETICHIISGPSFEIFKPVLILQPNLNPEELRLHLSKSGYAVTDERIARAAGRHYVILKAVPGKAVYSDDELIVGPVLLKKKDPNIATYTVFRIKVCEKALKGAKAGNDTDEIMKIEKQLAAWRRML